MESLKFELKQMTSENEGNMIKLLLKVINPNSTKKVNELLIHKTKVENLLKSERVEGITDSINTQRTQIQDGLLSFIDTLSDSDILFNVPVQEITYEKILIACKSEERVDYFDQLFPESYFPNVTFDSSGQKLSASRIDIIIYDDFPAHPDGKIDTVLKHYLENTEPVLLWYGIYSNLIKKYPEKAYSANSVFSLHSRLQEMINFLKYKEQAKIEKA